MFCEFIQLDDNHYECNNCGLIIKLVDGDSPPMFPCKRNLQKISEENDITFAQKISNFGKALSSHISQGMPQCSEEQILKRYSICQDCEFFKDETCSKCGCPIFRNKRFASKLAWADQECPIGKWTKEI